MNPAERHYWKRGSAGSKVFPTALSKSLICLLVPFHQNHDRFSFLAEQWKTCRHLIIMPTEKNVQHQSQINSYKRCLKTDKMMFWWIIYLQVLAIN